jgi:hypothetical protein
MAAIRAPEPSAEPEVPEAVQQLAGQIIDFIRQDDPEATYVITPPIDPGIWLMDVFVRPDLADDLDYGDRVVNHTVDLEIERGQDVSIIPSLRDRTQGTSVTTMFWCSP